MILRPTLAALTIFALCAVEAHALDQPVSARKLILRRTAGGQEKLAFLTKDPAVLFPPIDSADDPASGTPGGVTIELFSEKQGMATITIPTAVGWFTRDGSPSSYKFVNKLAPIGVSVVSSFLMKDGHAIRMRSAATGFPAGAALGRVGVRITMGSRRTCALFDETTIRRDEGKVFLARNAVSDGLADCSNTSLGGPTCVDGFDAPTCGGTCPDGSTCGAHDLASCECIAAAQPCGGTAPVCNGECPVGEACSDVGGLPLPSCACLPVGSTGCGGTAPTCGGDCPSGLGCFGISLDIGPVHLDSCECLLDPPSDVCGGCPAGFQCIAGGGIGPICIAFCNDGSGFPTCDGTCPFGLGCANVGTTCVCQ